MNHDTDSAVEPAGFKIQPNAPLAPLTTLGLGGAAHSLVEVDRIEMVAEAVRWARGRGLPFSVIGGGSNLVIADGGFSGVAMRFSMRGITTETVGDHALLTVAAGEAWDAIVERAVAAGFAGIECLSGIPGLVGATPIQNVGAYGQDVSSVISEVQVLDLKTLERRCLGPEECEFGYRTSLFRQDPGRFLVLGVTFRLLQGGEPKIAYRELAQVIGRNSARPTLATVREAVLELRRGKSMVVDEGDPNSRSVGSFFVNPEVDIETLETIEMQMPGNTELRRFEVGTERFKIPAAHLIESAGFTKGYRRGAVGISPAHALALIHYGGGTTAELLDLAREIRDGVEERFGVVLRPEPVFVGFDGVDPLAG